MASAEQDRKLTVGMATYDDFDGVYFTLQALRLYHREVADRLAFLVLDNNPGGPCSEALETLASQIPACRYFPTRDIQGTAVRDLIFREARTPYVLCVDSHVMLEPGAIARLLAYFDERPECRDLLQGPLVYDGLHKIATHFAPTWRDGMYGVWDVDERGIDPDGEPFDIPMQGLGLFAARKDAWLGFNPRFRRFGGEEGYIHEKFRRAGQRTLCLPFLRWIHRFQRPATAVYPITWRERIRNYVIGFDELGLDPEPMHAHFRELLGEEAAELYIREARQELASPFSYFDAIYCINLDTATRRREQMQRRFEALGIAARVRWFPAIETPESHHIGCTLSHRAIVERADRQGLDNVLVFEDDAIFHRDIRAHLPRSVDDLRRLAWNIFHLGGSAQGQDLASGPGSAHLRSSCAQLICSQAVAYNHPVFRRLLDDIPGDIAGVKHWIEEHATIGQYLRHMEGRYQSWPIVVSRRSILDREATEAGDEFALGDEAHEPRHQIHHQEDLPRPDHVYRLRSDIELTNLQGRVLLSGSTSDLFVRLNQTAGLIVNLLDGRRTMAEIRRLLLEAYPESAVDIVDDIDRIFGILVRDNIVYSQPPTAPAREMPGREVPGSVQSRCHPE